MRRLFYLVLYLALIAFQFYAAPSSAFTDSVTLTDAKGELGGDRAAVLANFDAALADWARYIKSDARLEILIEVTRHTGGAGRFTGRSIANVFHHQEQGFKVSEEGGTYKLRTGKSAKPGSPDLIIQIEPGLLRERYWIDPHPDLRSDSVPKGKTDLVTVFAHELGHAFGINGWIDLKTGAVPANGYISQYDLLTIKGSTSGAPFFYGPLTMKVYGGPLPVSFFSGTQKVVLNHSGRVFQATASETQNFRHYGRFSVSSPDESDQSFFGLMAGIWVRSNPEAGLRIKVGALDAAILGDLGVPLRD